MACTARALAFTAALAAGCLPAYAVNKCTMADGRVVYSDAPCPSASKETAVIEPAPPPAAAARSRPAAALRPLPSPATLAATAPPAKVMFSGTAQLDLVKATALTDNIRTLGRDCEWALKVDKSKMQVCVEFLNKLQPNGEFQQIGARVAEVIRELKADPSAAQQSMSELRTLSRYTHDVVRYKEFLLANLGNTSR